MEKQSAQTVLFLCTGNSCRSQMAEGFARKYFSPKWRAVSAGIEAHGLNPLAVAAMAEVGIDIAVQHSKTLAEIDPLSPEIVITLCGDARDRCPVFSGISRQEHWNLSDPAQATGSPEEVFLFFREIRDEIERRIEALARKLA